MNKMSHGVLGRMRSTSLKDLRKSLERKLKKTLPLIPNVSDIKETLDVFEVVVVPEEEQEDLKLGSRGNGITFSDDYLYSIIDIVDPIKDIITEDTIIEYIAEITKPKKKRKYRRKKKPIATS